MKEKDDYIKLLESMVEVLQHQTDKKKFPVKASFTNSCDISRIHSNDDQQNT